MNSSRGTGLVGVYSRIFNRRGFVTSVYRGRETSISGSEVVSRGRGRVTFCTGRVGRIFTRRGGVKRSPMLSKFSQRSSGKGCGLTPMSNPNKTGGNGPFCRFVNIRKC